MVFKFFFFFFMALLILILFSTRKNESSFLEMSIIPQDLNMNNLVTVSSNAINMQAIRNLIKYSLKNSIVKAMFIVTAFGIFLFEGRLVFSPAQEGTRSERVHVSFKIQKYIRVFCLNYLKVD